MFNEWIDVVCDVFVFLKVERFLFIDLLDVCFDIVMDFVVCFFSVLKVLFIESLLNVVCILVIFEGVLDRKFDEGDVEV